MHDKWCGKECANCETSCTVDTLTPCSPDCEFLSGDGIECLSDKPCDFLNTIKEEKENVI